MGVRPRLFRHVLQGCLPQAGTSAERDQVEPVAGVQMVYQIVRRILRLHIAAWDEARGAGPPTPAETKP